MGRSPKQPSQKAKHSTRATTNGHLTEMDALAKVNAFKRVFFLFVLSMYPL